MEDNKFLKWFSLVFLTLQNVSLVLMMRYVRTRPQEMFYNSTAVVCSEVIKLLASLLILLYSFKFDVRKFFQNMKEIFLQDPTDWGLIAVPAILYVIQNNLIFIAVSNLDAATFQVCYQLKLLTTAVFFKLLLKRSQSTTQWFSLLLLFIGIVLVQLQRAGANTDNSSVAQDRLLGIVVVLLGSVMSGFAGVFFEKILKGTQRNVWVRNLQLAVYGIVFGLVTVFATEGNSIITEGFFYGYDKYVWLVIVIQSVGGLLVAVVVKYADNILKGFATTVAIVLAAVISVPIFQLHLSPHFIIGASIVIVATILYNAFPIKQEISKSELPIKV